jgi:hypothetical protein
MEVRKGGYFLSEVHFELGYREESTLELHARACGFVTYLAPVGSVYAPRTGGCRMTNSEAPATQLGRRSGAHDGARDRAARRAGPGIHSLI